MTGEHITIEESALIYAGKRGLPGDAWNNLGGVQLALGNPESWVLISPVRTYERYLRENKFNWNPELAEAALAASNKELVARYDEIVSRINQVIGAAVTSQHQVNSLRELLNEMRRLIYQR